MTNRIFLLTLALAAALFTGCSKHSAQEPALPGHKVADLGVVEVADRTPTRHDLGDGRVCTVTPTLVPGGRIDLAIIIEESGTQLAAPRIQTVADRAVEISVGDVGIRLTPHIKQ
jgi:hypothetical protein